MNYLVSLKDQRYSVWSMLYLGAVGLLLLAGIGGNAKPTWAQSGPTTINIGTTVQRSSVKRLGINLSGQLYYDSAQMLRNLTFGNSGFEAQIWQSVLVCQKVSGTTCSDGSTYAQWPNNFLQGGTFTFIYGSSTATGTLVSMTAASGNGSGVGVVYDFGSVSPKVGDVFVIKKSFPGGPDVGWWPSTGGGATITADTTDLSPNTPGVQAVSLNANGSGQSAMESSYFDSTAGRSFINLNGTYTINFRAKSKGGSNQLNVRAGRFNSGDYFNQNISLTGNWQDYSYNFTADETGKQNGTAYLQFSVNGGAVLLDDAYLSEAAGSNNTTPFRDAVLARLQALNPGVLRYMDSGYDFGSTIDNMIALPEARVRAGFGQGGTVASVVPMGLEEFLVLCQAIGAEPWYTMPMGISPAEAQNLIQFLAGDASTPYGAKRAALGQSAPWTSVFPMIHLELGDEAWNTAFSGDTIVNPVAYGTRAGAVFGAARAEADYDPSKFDLILDGWAANSWWGQQALNNAGNNYDTIDAAPYTFDTLTSFATPEAIFGSMFADPEGIDDQTSGQMYQQMQMVTGVAPGLTGKQPNLAVYEVNLGTTAGTAPQNILDSTLPSLGAGLSTVEHMLLMLRDDGVSLQTLFALPGYANGFNNYNGGGGTIKLWGSVVDMGGPTNCSRPQFLAEQLANTAVGGTMLATTLSGANPTWDEKSPNDNVNQIDVPNAHYLQSFAFTNGTEDSLIVFNLSRTSALPVTFTGANAPSGNVQVGLLTGPSLSSTNENGSVVAIANSTVQNFDPTAIVNLPPFSMTVYRWSTSSGVHPPKPAATTTALTASPTSAQPGQTVVLTASVSTANKSVPSGNVQFNDGSTSLGTSALVSGQVSLSVSNLATGTHSISASFLGSASDGSSSSAPVTVTIATAGVPATTTTLKAPSRVTEGAPAAFMATVAAASGATPTGSVSFYYGQSLIGTSTLYQGTTTLNLNSVTIPLGTYQVTAVYAGDSQDSASTSTSSTLLVAAPQPRSTVSTLTLSPTKITTGQAVTATVKVTAASGSAPAGTVNFYVGATNVGTAKVVAGSATYTTNVELSPGSYQVEATYTGSSTDAASTSAPVTLTVTSAAAVATVTSLTSSTWSTTAGNPVVFTATVLPQTSGVTATGAVTFYLGQTVLGTGQLAGGRAALSLNAAFAPGTYQVSAAYAGNSADEASTSGPISLVVTADVLATSISLTASATQLTPGQSAQLSATVAAIGSRTVPPGSVDFYLSQTKIATATLVNGSAATSFPASAFAPGTYLLTAVYTGSALDTASTSAPVTMTIAPSASSTTTTLVSSAAALTEGQSFSLTAVVGPAAASNAASSTTVSTASTPAPAGTVSFYLGQIALGTATLVDGRASLTENANFAPGSYPVTAVYSGSTLDTPSVSAPVSLVVSAATTPGNQALSTATTLAINPQQPTAGQGMSFTIEVSAGSAHPPTGTVTVYLGATPIATATAIDGKTVLTLTAPAAGTYGATAVFAGEGQYSASQSSPLTFTVQAAAASLPVVPNPAAGSFTVALSSRSASYSSSAQTTAAQASTLLVTVAGVNHFSGAVQLSCSGLPAGVDCNFSPATLNLNTANAISTLSFSAGNNNASYTLIISNVAYGLLLPWDIVGFFGFFSARRRRSARRTALQLALGLGLLASLAGVTGCGVHVNSVTEPYLVTVTAEAANQPAQTTTFTLYMTQPAGSF